MCMQDELADVKSHFMTADIHSIHKSKHNLVIEKDMFAAYQNEF